MPTSTKDNDSEIDLKKLFYRIASIWYYILGSVAIALLISFLYNRYADRVYEVEASVLIKNVSSLDFSQIIFDSDKKGANREIANEIYILKSIPLIEETIIKDNLTSRYYRRTSALQRFVELDEASVPFKLISIANNPSFQVSIPLSKIFIDGSNFELQDESSGKVLVSGKFGEPFFFENDTFLLHRSFDYEENSLEDAELYISKSPLKDAVNDYRNSLRIQLIEDESTIIRLSMETRLPSKELRFLRGLLETYLQSNIDEKNEQSNNSIQFINAELESIADSLKRIETQIQVFKSNNKINSVSTDAERILEQLFDLESKKAEILLVEKYFDYIRDYFDKQESNSIFMHPSSFGIADPVLEKQASELISLQEQLKLNNARSEGLAALRKDIQSRVDLISKSIIGYIENLEMTNRIQLKDITSRISTVENSLRGLSFSEIQLMNILRLHKLSESMYLLLMEKKAEAEILQSSNTSDFKIIDSPRLISSAPLRPKGKIIYILSLLIGFLLPIAVLLVYDYLDNTIKLPEDIKITDKIPFMGSVASLNEEQLKHYYISENPKSHLAESFRTIRANLNYIQTKRKKIIAVTSFFPGEGKTFISSNLALSLGSGDKKVILIGADLRKPRVHEEFNINNKNGLSNYLVGQLTLDQCISKTANNAVDIMTCGPIPPNPVELLENGRFERLMEELAGTYDHIVIDTAPFGLVSDTLVLFDQTDVNFIVLRSGVSKSTQLAQIEEVVSKNSRSTFGLILNDVDSSLHYGSYGYGYGNGYGYYAS